MMKTMQYSCGERGVKENVKANTHVPAMEIKM